MLETMIRNLTFGDSTGVTALGEWMRERRERARLTQTECAHRAGFSPQRWKQLESGESRRGDGKPTQVSRDTVEKIAVGLGAPVSEALQVAGYAPDSMQEQPYNLTSAPDEWAPDDGPTEAYYRGLAPEMQDAVREMIKAAYLASQRAETTHGKKAE
jgi:transcriptional regulator with XRE-family HTH domain